MDEIFKRYGINCYADIVDLNEKEAKELLKELLDLNLDD